MNGSIDVHILKIHIAIIILIIIFLTIYLGVGLNLYMRMFYTQTLVYFWRTEFKFGIGLFIDSSKYN